MSSCSSLILLLFCTIIACKFEIHSTHQPTNRFALNPNFNVSKFFSRASLTIEVLVAVDQSMIENHGKHNLEEYVLALMSIASDRFCDLKIGYSIRLAVIGVIFIEKNLHFRYVRTNVEGHEYFGRFFFVDKSIFD